MLMSIYAFMLTSANVIRIAKNSAQPPVIHSSSAAISSPFFDP